MATPVAVDERVAALALTLMSETPHHLGRLLLCL